MNRQEQEQVWIALRQLQESLSRLKEDVEQIQDILKPLKPVKRDVSRKARI